MDKLETKHFSKFRSALLKTYFHGLQILGN